LGLDVSLEFTFLMLALAMISSHVFRSLLGQAEYTVIFTQHFLNTSVSLYLSLITIQFVNCSLYKWLRQYARSRKVAGSHPDEVDIFKFRNPSCRSMVLRSTQLLTEISTRNLKKETWGVKGGRRIGLINLPNTFRHSVEGRSPLISIHLCSI
jgi:hypothetical protein